MAKETQSYFQDVPPRVNADELERGILEYWKKEKIFEKSLEQNKDKELFTFYDGPPYATGKPHYGHVLQSAIKDTVLRYKTMQGYYVPRRVGWDTHGLPIENIVEKELGITSKREIEDDIEAFNKRCRETVLRYVDEFTSTLKRIGRWADYDNAYSTLDRDYMESEWWVFRQLWDSDLIYKAFRTTPYCVRCATPLSNFEVSMAYKDKTDMAVYVALAISPTSPRKAADAATGLPGANQQVYLLIWTTTPWTLPGNAAVAMNPDIEYVTAQFEDKQFILAKDRVEAVLGPEATIVHTWDSDELQQLTYQPPLPGYADEQETAQAFRVVPGEHVTADDGTGLVHIAPAFGEEDAHVGKQHNLPVLRTVDTLGNITEQGQYPWAGMNVFEANKPIIRHLKEEGLLFKQEQYRHSYPFCWRCDTPLIYFALDTWFVNVQKLKNHMVKNNEDIHWIPEHVKDGRFGKGLESAPDWAVSRNRFWSVPMPIWECDSCEHRLCVESIKELADFSGASEEELADIHRPYVDRITWNCKACGSGTMKRIPEVLDVWFDSGSMPYSQWHYPFERKEFVEAGFPADFIVESIEMTRAWFYVLHVLATALTQKDLGLGTHQPAYKNVIASGLIFAEDGQKLSKKLKNYTEIEPTLEQYGADTLRLYLLTSASLGEPYRFSEKELRQLQRNAYMTLWNVYSFFVRYAAVHNWTPGETRPAATHILDQWILARLTQLETDLAHHADAYRVDSAARLFLPFIDDLSNWYVRRSRDRFQPASSTPEDTSSALATLYEVLRRSCLQLAPFMPFVAEEMYRNLTHQPSVHLETLPEATSLGNEEKSVLQSMDMVRSIVSTVLAQRAKAGIKVRQPLQGLNATTNVALSSQYLEMVKEEVNVDEVTLTVNQDGAAMPEVTLDTTMTPELKSRGLAREIIRHGQMLRRQANYALNDRIIFVARTEDSELQEVLTAQATIITDALQADAVVEKTDSEDAGEEVKLTGKKIYLGVKRAVIRNT